MKSLQESLFDNGSSQMMESLFDKDLVERDIPRFGDVFEPYTILVNRVKDMSIDDVEKIMSIFNHSKLQRDIKPLDLSKVTGYDPKTLSDLQYILTLIANIPVSKSECDSWKTYQEVLKDDIKEVFGKYKKPGTWTSHRSFATMFVDIYRDPFLRIGLGQPYMYIEIYFMRKR